MRLRRIAALLAVTGLCAACGSGEVDAVPADRAGDPACAQAVRHWPRQVGGADSRPVSANSPAVRAWGDPAIIARCGVTSPGPTADPCFGVSGVDWVGHRLDDGYRFVTYGRTPALEVLVPSRYSPEPMVLGAFTDAARALPQGPHRCT